MDLTAVAARKARGGRPARESDSVAASGTAGTSRDGSMDGQDDSDSDTEAAHLDAESAKQLLRVYVKNSLDGVRSGARAQYYE